jgi:hypothetical protein
MNEGKHYIRQTFRYNRLATNDCGLMHLLTLDDSLRIEVANYDCMSLDPGIKHFKPYTITKTGCLR